MSVGVHRHRLVAEERRRARPSDGGNGDQEPRRNIPSNGKVLAVVKSLINQRIALAEARNLGISVSEEQVEAAVVGILGQGVTEASLASTVGMDGLRRRVRERIGMEAVKDNVNGGG